jgi:hypothetical protein
MKLTLQEAREHYYRRRQESNIGRILWLVGVPFPFLLILFLIRRFV